MGRRTLTNSNAVSTDLIGMNWDYPDADYARRGRNRQRSTELHAGLLY